MPTPPLRPGHPKWPQAIEAHARKQKGERVTDIASSIDTPRNTVDSWINAVARYEDTDPAISEAMETVGTGMTPNMVWIKTKSHSVQLVPQKTDHQEDIEARIAEKFASIPAAPTIRRPVQTSPDILAMYPIFDAHMGLQIGSYGLQASFDRLLGGFESVIARTDSAERCLILNGGDWTHQNDPSNQTPASKHALDVDGSYDDTIDAAVDLTAAIIDMALQRHAHVVYKPIQGNHDPHTAQMLRIGIAQRYRSEPRVTIDAGTVWMAFPWERNLLCAHHGNFRGLALKDLVMMFASRYSEHWHHCQHRELHTGHLHHLKTMEFPGMACYQHRAASPASRHDIDSGYNSKSEMTSLTYHKNAGRIASTNHLLS